MKKRVCLFMATLTLAAFVYGCGRQSSVSMEPLPSKIVIEEKKQVEQEVIVEEDKTDVVVAEAEEENEELDAFEEFLKGNSTTTIDIEMDTPDMSSVIGKTVTLEEFSNMASTDYNGEIKNTTKSVAYITRNDVRYMLLKYAGLDIYSPDDGSYTVYVLVEKADGLHVTHSESEWARRGFEINAKGMISSGGSNGAGDYGSEIKYLDENGKAQNLVISETCYPGWIGSLTEYFKMGMFSDYTIQLAEAIDMEGENIMAEGFNNITFFDIRNNIYALLDGPADNEYVAAYIEATRNEGVLWYSEEEIGQMIDDLTNSLGLNTEESDKIEWNNI